MFFNIIPLEYFIECLFETKVKQHMKYKHNTSMKNLYSFIRQTYYRYVNCIPSSIRKAVPKHIPLRYTQTKQSTANLLFYYPTVYTIFIHSLPFLYRGIHEKASGDVVFLLHYTYYLSNKQLRQNLPNPFREFSCSFTQS